MSDTMAIFYLLGTVITLVTFAVLFAKRYPRQSGWIAIGVAIGIAMMFLWPVTIWIAIAMGLTGFGRPRTRGVACYQKSPLIFPKKVVIPLCLLGVLITIGVIRAMTESVAELRSATATAPATTPAPPVSTAPVPMITVVDGDGDGVACER